ncbi:MAG: phytanoyl-CoA dioxygenase family protein [Phycisphaerae bacterium]|nr:phytanoyl-CoA dioxygenase family protein [Phycisphaerae bacterium]NUQ44723.1 phytanoyl-CoA dioxygenase family protein [Phycisphaerae bacterium]
MSQVTFDRPLALPRPTARPAALKRVHCRRDPDWLPRVLRALQRDGCAVVEGVLDAGLIDRVVPALYAVRERILDEIGLDRLRRAGELGVLRALPKFDPLFLELIELSEVLAVVDGTVGPTSILHLQNGLLLPSSPPESTPSIFQNRFHMDFPRVLNGYLCSINLLFAISPFSCENGGTLVVPGTHQRQQRPGDAWLEQHAIAVECPAGSLLVFDSTLYHAAGRNTSGADRLGINQQFTQSYFKQQIDLVRAIGDETVGLCRPRTQQLLGWYTRVPTSLDEFYRPPVDRLYRSGQG